MRSLTVGLNEIVNDGGKLIYMYSTGLTLQIVDIGITPSLRLNGYGRDLIEKLEDIVRSNEYRFIYLFTETGNTDAQDFYKKCGYIIVAQIYDMYKTGHALMYGKIIE